MRVRVACGCPTGRGEVQWQICDGKDPQHLSRPVRRDLQERPTRSDGRAEAPATTDRPYGCRLAAPSTSDARRWWYYLGSIARNASATPLGTAPSTACAPRSARSVQGTGLAGPIRSRLPGI